MLKNNYGYTDDNIYVIMSDGTGSSADLSNGTSSPVDLDGNGTVDIDYAAHSGQVSSVFTSIGNKTLNGGDVFLYITGYHGGNSNYTENALFTWGGSNITKSMLLD